MARESKTRSVRTELRTEVKAHEPHIAILPRLTWLDAAGGGDATQKENVLHIRARPLTDWYSAPRGFAHSTNAPALTFPLNVDLRLSCRVRTRLYNDFDAAVQLVYQGKDDYAKLCVERLSDGARNITSTVTREASDDCVGPGVDADQAVRLMVLRSKNVIAFYCAAERAHKWSLVRIFRMLDIEQPAYIGFCAQSPIGDGCEAHFDDFVLIVGQQPDPRVRINVETDDEVR
eukprot:IDg20505t1